MPLLASLSLKTKLGLVVGLLTTLLAAFAWGLFSQWRESESTLGQELFGSRLYGPIYEVIHSAQLHRGASLQLARGNTAARAQVDAAKTRFDAALSTLNDLEAGAGRPLGGEHTLANIARDWQALEDRRDEWSPEQGFQAHTALIDDIIGHLEALADDTHLSLDNNLDGAHLVNIASFTLPRALEYAARLRGQAAGMVAQHRELSPEQLSRLRQDKPIAFDKIEQAVRATRRAASGNDSGALAKSFARLDTAGNRYQAMIDDIINTGVSAVDSQTVFATGTEFVEAGFAVADDTHTLLENALKVRLDDVAMRNRTALATLVVTLVISFSFVIIIVKTMLRELQRANSHLASIRNGQLDNDIQPHGSDELARLLEGIADMQSGLRDTRERERATADEIHRMANASKRIADALEVCATPVMLADNDYRLQYMNQACARLLKMRETSLKAAIPGFSAADLDGFHLEHFHTNAAGQHRDQVAHLRAVESLTLNVGSLVFGQTLTPLFDGDGKRTGTIVEWDDMTDRLARAREEQRIAAENLRVRIALDNSSTNAMITDADQRVVYVNQALQRLFGQHEAQIQRDIPGFSAARLAGTDLAIFERIAAQQGRQQEFLLGDLTVRLNTNPVINAQGERLGTVAEWVDRTQEARVEREIAELLNAAANGDFSRTVDAAGKQGFFLALTEGLNQLTTMANRGLTDIARVMAAMAEGDLTSRITGDHRGLFGQVKADMNATVDKLTEVLSSIMTAAQAVSSGADELAQGNADLSQRTEEQASSLEETASSMEEMTSTVRQTSDNARQAHQRSNEAVTVAESGRDVVRKAVVAMADIAGASKRIVDIVGLIDDIAFQINLLALNAAVEAARAGEHGRGFAVVAGAVRELAQRSASAAREIKVLIQDSVSKVDAGTGLVNASGTTLENIVDTIREVSKIIAEINTAAREQASSIEQINTAVSQMDRMTQQNAALVEEATAAGETMADQATRLMQMVGFFTVDGHIRH